MIRTYLGTLLLILLVINLLSCSASVGKNSGPEGEKIATFILVRHAEKADDGTKDPALTEQGHQRADRLAKMLKSAGVAAIYSTDFKRTRQTAGPLAETLGLEVKMYIPSEEKDFHDIQIEASGKTVLIVGHSNTIPGMVNQLIGEERFDQLDDSEYDKLFIVTTWNQKARVTTLSY